VDNQVPRTALAISIPRIPITNVVPGRGKKGKDPTLSSLDTRLTDGGKGVSPTHPPHFTPQKHYYFKVSGTHFC
jgi:hypothetical protein